MVWTPAVEATSKLTRFLEVAQQSKARRKDDFLIAFSPVSIAACIDRLLANFARLSRRL